MSHVPIPADPERDARVAARRAADARKAGAALGRLLDDGDGNRPTSLGSIYGRGWRDGYRACAEDYLASELQHNRDSGVDGLCGFPCGHDPHPWHDGMCPGIQHNAHYVITDHRYEAWQRGRPCEVILTGLDASGACGRAEQEHAHSAWSVCDAQDHPSGRSSARPPHPYVAGAP